MIARDELQVVTSGEAGEILGVCAQRVRQLGDEGKLTVLRTTNKDPNKQFRLFLLAEVEALKAARLEKAEALVASLRGE